MGGQVLFNVSKAGHFALSVAAFGVKDAPPVERVATQSVSWFPRDNEAVRPKMANGGIFLPGSEGGLYKFVCP